MTVPIICYCLAGSKQGGTRWNKTGGSRVVWNLAHFTLFLPAICTEEEEEEEGEKNIGRIKFSCQKMEISLCQDQKLPKKKNIPSFFSLSPSEIGVIRSKVVGLEYRRPKLHRAAL